VFTALAAQPLAECHGCHTMMIIIMHPPGKRPSTRKAAGLESLCGAVPCCNGDGMWFQEH
jgi:hypothetical protein